MSTEPASSPIRFEALVLSPATSGMLMARGAVAIVFGVLALAWPIATALGLALLFAIYALVDGVSLLFSSFRGHAGGFRWATAISGVLGILFGVLTLVWPGITVLALAILVGIWAVATGIGEIVAAVRLRKQISGEVFLGLAGGFSVLAGLVILLQPIAGVVGIATVLGIFALLYGISLVVLAFRLRKMAAA